MARVVSIGTQDFETLITGDCFYIDKTKFIKEWWENRDAVTLITRPRRFGKTLNMSMLERFFSIVTTTSDEYSSCFGFTEEEVFSAMDEFGMDNKEEVKE